MSGPAGQSLDWRELARAAAGGAVADAATEARRDLLVVDLAGEPYALAVERVREIVRLPPVTPVPRMPEPVRGIAVLRGEVVQVIDLRRRLGLPAAPLSGAARLVLLHGEGRDAGALLVDAVREVASVCESAVEPPPPRHSRLVHGLAHWEGRFVSLLDVDEVLAIHADAR